MNSSRRLGVLYSHKGPSEFEFFEFHFFFFEIGDKRGTERPGNRIPQARDSAKPFVHIRADLIEWRHIMDAVKCGIVRSHVRAIRDFRMVRTELLHHAPFTTTR